MVPSINQPSETEAETVADRILNVDSTAEDLTAENAILPLEELREAQQTNSVKEATPERCESNVGVYEAIENTVETSKEISNGPNEDPANESVTMSEIAEDITAILNEIENDSVPSEVNDRRPTTERHSTEQPKDTPEEVNHYENMNTNLYEISNGSLDTKIGVITTENVETSVKTELELQNIKSDPDVMIIEVKHEVITISDDSDIQSIKDEKNVKPIKQYKKSERQSTSCKRPGLKILQNNALNQQRSNAVHASGYNASNLIMPLMETIPVNITSGGFYETFTRKEQNFIRARVRQGYNIHAAQDLVRIRRAEKRNRRRSNERTTHAKRKRVNEKTVTKNNKNLPNSSSCKSNSSIEPEKVSEIINLVNENSVLTVCADTNIKSSTNVSSNKIEDNIGSQVNVQMQRDPASQTALEYEIQFKGLRLPKPPNARYNVSKQPMTSQEAEKGAIVVSNQVERQIQLNSSILEDNQVMAGPLPGTIFSDINDIADFSNSDEQLGTSNVLATSKPTSTSQSQSQQPTVLYKVAIVHAQHPLQNLTEVNIDEIKRSLLAELDSMENVNAYPGFLGCTYKNGGLILTCHNDETKNWLFTIIESLKPFPWGHIKGIEEIIHPRYLCQTYIPAADLMSFSQLLLRLEKQNFGLLTKNWDIVKIESVPEGGKNIAFTVDALSKQKILAQNRKLFLNFGQIYIQINDEVENFDHTTEHSADTVVNNLTEC